MPLHKGFLKADFSPLAIGAIRFSGGIFTGLLSAFAIYAFYTCFGESIRLIEFGYNDFWIRSEEDRYAFQLFIAGTSVAFGLSQCIEIWYSKPHRPIRAVGFWRHSVINDGRVMSWVFLFWFAKMTLVFGVFLMMEHYHHAFDFYPDYWWVGILLVIVLNLQPVLTFRRLYKNSAKWMMGMMIICFLYAFGLSSVELLDHNKIDSILYNRHPDSQLSINLPITNNAQQYWFRSRDATIHIGNNHDKDSVIVFNNEITSFNDLSAKIYAHTLDQPVRRGMGVVHLHMDEAMDMQTVGKIKRKLALAGYWRLIYSTTPFDAEYPQRYYHDWGLRSILRRACPDLEEEVELLTSDTTRLVDYPSTNWWCLGATVNLFRSNKILIIKTLENGLYEYDHTSYTLAGIGEMLIEYNYLYNKDMVVVITYENRAQYRDYVDFLDLIYSLKQEQKIRWMQMSPLELEYVQLIIARTNVGGVY